MSRSWNVGTIALALVLAFTGGFYFRGVGSSETAVEVPRSGTVFVGQQPATYETENGKISAVVIGYETPGERVPLQLVYEPARRRVLLRKEIPQGMIGTGNDVEVLGHEVWRLASSIVPIKLDDSGFYFYFRGGDHLIWGPHEQIGRNHRFSALLFAEDVDLNSGIIEARGQPQKVGYYPYPDLSWKNDL